MPTIIEQLHQMPWAEAFSNRALDKARRYAKENRVKIIDLDDLTVSAAQGWPLAGHQVCVFAVRCADARAGLSIRA
ncbi:hypothetical protein [Pseudomonas sp. B21-048]|uniref:hypothetical protein n=1 Tax=Pseudomonas sp. B21-048 TaxID=2895490 RepID=UPI002160D853|nr:hypothetical protein [Pseudomonas sp. B21-048]UVL00455.1 hypothetical protein LOY56_08845 [Pseudomonas sp. B21-048]